MHTERAYAEGTANSRGAGSFINGTVAVKRSPKVVRPTAGQFGPVLATSEVIPSRAVRALEGEGRGLSHLEVVARGAVVAPASQWGYRSRQRDCSERLRNTTNQYRRP
jgi:hypothetical protein